MVVIKMSWVLLLQKTHFYLVQCTCVKENTSVICLFTIPDNDLSFSFGGNKSVGGSEYGGTKSGAVHVPTGGKQSGCAHGKIRKWYQLIFNSMIKGFRRKTVLFRYCHGFINNCFAVGPLINRMFIEV